MSWSTFLDEAPVAEHAVQVYDGLSELCSSVGYFADAGFRREEPFLMVATADKQSAFRAEIERRGWHLDALEDESLLICRDAEELLNSFMDGGAPSPAFFEESVGSVVDDLASRFPSKTLRAFGCMVDVLWQRGNLEAAIALEELWNELAETRAFALLCAYHLDIFDIAVQSTALPEIVRAHTQQRTAEHPSKLATAVDHALTDVVGPRQAGQIYLQVAEQVPRTQLARATEVLMWLSHHDEPSAKQVLDSARSYYAHSTATSVA